MYTKTITGIRSATYSDATAIQFTTRYNNGYYECTSQSGINSYFRSNSDLEIYIAGIANQVSTRAQITQIGNNIAGYYLASYVLFTIFVENSEFYCCEGTHQNNSALEFAHTAKFTTLEEAIRFVNSVGIIKIQQFGLENLRTHYSTQHTQYLKDILDSSDKLPTFNFIVHEDLLKCFVKFKNELLGFRVMKVPAQIVSEISIAGGYTVKFGSEPDSISIRQQTPNEFENCCILSGLLQIATVTPKTIMRV